MVTAGEVYLRYHQMHIDAAKRAAELERDDLPLLAEPWRREARMCHYTMIVAHDFARAEAGQKGGYLCNGEVPI